MGIRGLTDLQAALPIIGTIRKGEENKSANAPGKDLTFFRFTSDDSETVAQFAGLYGPEPRTINVLLPFKTTDENMDAWIEKWVAGGLEYRSDGETCVLYRTNTGFSDKPKPDPRPAVGEDGKRADGSMQVGRLSIIIPEMARLATVTVLTTSKHDIMNLARQLRSIEAINGDLRGIPFVLNRRPKMISTPAGNGKRARREKWLLSIETHQRGTMAILQQMEQKALPGHIEEIEDDNDYIMPMLPSNVINPFDDEQSPVPQPKTEPVKPAPQPAPAKQPADPWPTKTGPVFDFCQVVQELTNNGFTSQYHLSNSIGGFGNLSKQAEFEDKLAKAVAHVNSKQQPTQATIDALDAAFPRDTGYSVTD